MKAVAMKLPREIWLLIFTQLSYKDLCQLSATSRAFHLLVTNEWLWKRKCLVDFETEQILSVILGDSVEKTLEDLNRAIKGQGCSWKTVYSRIHQEYRQHFQNMKTRISNPGDGWGVTLSDIAPSNAGSFHLSTSTNSTGNILKTTNSTSGLLSMLTITSDPSRNSLINSTHASLSTPLRSLLRGRLTFERSLVQKIPPLTIVRSLNCNQCHREFLKTPTIGTMNTMKSAFGNDTISLLSLRNLTTEFCMCTNTSISPRAEQYQALPTSSLFVLNSNGSNRNTAGWWSQNRLSQTTSSGSLVEALRPDLFLSPPALERLSPISPVIEFMDG